MKKVIIIGSGIPSMRLMEIAAIKNSKIEIVASNQTGSPFDREPLRLQRVPTLPKVQILYDKKGKPLELPKLKFHK